jgi:hypothetical protein
MEFRELVKTALLGSEKQVLTLPPPGGPLNSALAQLDPADPEGALLGAAAMLSLYRTAGQMPATSTTPPPAPCPPDEQPQCSRRAAHHLAMMMEGHCTEVLPEWLRAAAAAGVRVPPLHLPALLNKGRAQASLREDMLPVLGRRGYWLAAYNANWSYIQSAEEQDAEEVWQTGSAAARRLLLAHLRRTDPPRARAMLQTTRASEAAKDRAAFLEALRVGLSLDDELLLEGALDDRSKEVRRAAANLLASLPGSQLVQRMTARVQPLLVFQKGGLLKKATLEVALPEECTKEMQRDGIEPKPPDKKHGEKAWWLVQMLGAVPPAFWCQQWGISAEDAVKIASKGEWKQTLLDGWAAATLRQHDAIWAEALLAGGGDWAGALLNLVGVPPAHLITILSAERGEQIILKMAPAAFETIQPMRQFMQYMRHYPFAWSEALSLTLLQNIQHKIAKKNRQSELYGLSYELLDLFARRASTTVFEEASQFLAERGDEWTIHDNRIQKSLDILQFRHDMLEALQEH